MKNNNNKSKERQEKARMTLKVNKKNVYIGLVLYIFVIYIISQSDAVFLRYACKPNGDLSVMNFNTSYKSALAFNTMGYCISKVVKNFTVIKITNCPEGDESGIVKIILSQVEKDGLDYVGGRDQITTSVRCSMPSRPTSSLVRINMQVRGLFRQVSGFSDGFYEREPTLSIEMYDLTGETGYEIFTISYPIGVVITGPPGSDILPEVCHAYSARNIEKGLTARVLKDGCALDHKLMFSFSKEPADWFDRNITEFDMDRFVLEPGMFHDVMFEESEEEPLPPPPQLFTHMYAFRFFLSNYILVHCEVRICPPGSEGCVLPCNDTIKAIEKRQIKPENEGEQLEGSEEKETETELGESDSDTEPEEKREIEKPDDSTENDTELDESDSELPIEEDEEIEQEGDLQNDVGEFDDSEQKLEGEEMSEIEHDDLADNASDLEESEQDIEPEEEKDTEHEKEESIESDEEVEKEEDDESPDTEADLYKQASGAKKTSDQEQKSVVPLIMQIFPSIKLTEIETSALQQGEFGKNIEPTTATTLSARENDVKTYSNQIIGGRPDKIVPKTRPPGKETESTDQERNELFGSLDLIPPRLHRRKRALRHKNSIRTMQDPTTRTIFRKFIIRKNSALKPHYVWDTLPKSDMYESRDKKKVGKSNTDSYTITEQELNSHPRVVLKGQD